MILVIYFSYPGHNQDGIIRLCRNFLWNSKRSLVAWTDVCLPKIEGRLGFRDINCWNNTLLAKSLCNTFSKKKNTLGLVDQSCVFEECSCMGILT